MGTQTLSAAQTNTSGSADSFTPGPWHYLDTDEVVASCSDGYPDSDRVVCTLPNIGDEANGRLIAAAPDGHDVAAALIQFIGRSDLDDIDFGQSLAASGIIEQAKTYLAKVHHEGEAHDRT